MRLRLPFDCKVGLYLFAVMATYMILGATLSLWELKAFFLITLLSIGQAHRDGELFEALKEVADPDYMLRTVKWN